MRRAVIGSLAVHAGIATVWVCVAHAPEDARVEAPPIAVTIEEPPPPAPPAPGRGGGGDAAPAKPKAIATATHAARRATARDGLVVNIERGGDGGRGRGTGGGLGDGIGLGTGDGAGDGDGFSAARSGFSGALPEAPPPPATAPSKARPPRLLYPTHRADEGDDTPPFIARVTVDTDGYVVGARLVTGTDQPRATDAASAIWRFRYDPARDDAGRAVRATVDQDFLLQ